MFRAEDLTLRELGSGDWLALRDLRLHGLATEPGVFFRHHDEEAARTDEEWIALATGDDAHQLFGLFANGRAIAISGVLTDRNDPSGTTAMFGMTYVLPEFRGRGLSARLFETRLAWVRGNARFARAVVGHRSSNVASRRAIERAGFVRTGEFSHRWPDGCEENDVVYEMHLRDLDPRCVASGNYTLAFENERVRVLSFTANPGERWEFHAHPDSVVISLGDYTVGNVVPGAAPTSRVARRGESAWIPAVAHAGENLGETVMECVLVELKNARA